ncbi:hypothetical protein F5Y13DRAFT_198825 [Hypoxylon sp. FL1857]|nr:hypothetical protein F5Y13DRAFT_198825 [Hypoxylon sp. FL1857]
MKLLSGASISILAASLANAQGSGDHAPHVPFSVTKFSAGAIPHSSVGYVEFNMSFVGGAVPATCSAHPEAYQSFPSAVVQTPCSDPSASFNLTRRADGGAYLQLWHEVKPGAFAQGFHVIQANEIVWTNEQSPTGKVQVYLGPENFTVDVTYP